MQGKQANPKTLAHKATEREMHILEVRKTIDTSCGEPLEPQKTEFTYGWCWVTLHPAAALPRPSMTQTA